MSLYKAPSAELVDKYGHPLKYDIYEVLPIANIGSHGVIDRNQPMVIASITQAIDPLHMPVDLGKLTDKVICLMLGLNPVAEKTVFDFSSKQSEREFSLFFSDPELKDREQKILTLIMLSSRHQLDSQIGTKLARLYDRELGLVRTQLRPKP